MPEFTYIGGSHTRLDAVGKVTGEARYTDDLALPRMLHAKILRSPYAHAEIKRMDVAQAAVLPGVRAIVTGEDTRTMTFGFGRPADQIPLAVDKVLYVGQEVAAVAAEDEDIAAEALRLIDIEYEVLPIVLDPLEATRAGSAPVHGENLNNMAREFHLEYGDVAKGFAESDYVFEDRFVTNLVQHCTLETFGCIATYSHDGKLTLYAATQNVFVAQMQLAKVLELPLSKIRVVQPAIGAGFGSKFAAHEVHIIASVLAMKARRPVKLVVSREEAFLTGRFRHAFVIDLKTGVKKDGTLVAKEGSIICNNGAFTEEGTGVLSCAMIAPEAAFKWSHSKMDGYLVYTNTPYAGAFRGFGNPQMTFAVQSQMHMIAEKLGIDLAEMFLRNARESGELNPYDWKIDNCELKACIKRAIEIRERLKSARSGDGASGSRRRGIGMACLGHIAGTRAYFDYDGSTALIKIDEDGKALIVTGEGEIGQDISTTFAIIAAEILGIGPEDISVTQADTDTTPFCLGAYSSRLTTVAGMAVKKAAEDARDQLFQVASRLLEARTEDLVARDGRVHVAGSLERGVEIAQLVKASIYQRHGQPIIGKGITSPDTDYPDPISKRGDRAAAKVYGAEVVEVEVDTETGQATILNLFQVKDSGKIINRLAAVGQVEGGLVQGMSIAMREGMQFDDRGMALNASFLDYKISTALDVPRSFGPVFLDVEASYGPFGAKGVSENVGITNGASLANAIYDAVGVRIKELPITPDRVLAALKARSTP